MKVNSAVKPNNFYVRKVEVGVAYVKLRRNIVEVTDEEDNIGYEYDEVEIEIVDRPDLAGFINDNFNSLFQLGLDNEQVINEPSLEERIQALEIIELERLLGGDM